jgi:hypothetical protein
VASTFKLAVAVWLIGHLPPILTNAAFMLPRSDLLRQIRGNEGSIASVGLSATFNHGLSSYFRLPESGSGSVAHKHGKLMIGFEHTNALPTVVADGIPTHRVALDRIGRAGDL